MSDQIRLNKNGPVPYSLIRAVLFDVDGVILDSNDAIVRCTQEVARHLGREVPDRDQIISLLGIPLKKWVTALFGDDHNSWTVYRKFMKTYLVNLKYMPYARSALKRIKLKKGIVTSRKLVYVKQDLGDILHLFDAIITYENSSRGKPHPHALLLACRKLKIRQQEAIYVGDTVRDVIMAKNAGMHFIGFLSGGASEDEFRAAGAKTIVRSFREIPQLLNERFSHTA